MIDAAKARILLAEDDPVSRAFLVETLRQSGCSVEAVEDGETALAAARERRFDLLIFDRSLPGLRGDQALRALRPDANAVSRDAPAIATTAEPDTEIHSALRNAGFCRVLIKPLSAESLQEALRESGIASAILDDAAGLAASGSAEILSALRGLFAAELEMLDRDFDAACRDHAALRERLHRLRASCGFCGARSLQTAAAELSDALQHGESERIANRNEAFRNALAATRALLNQDSA